MRTRLHTTSDLFTDHDEQTFRSLLDVEHRRCQHSGQAFHVLLCLLSTEESVRLTITGLVKSALLSAMRESLRKTDPMGWFLQDLVLGALLSGNAPRPSALSSHAAMSQARRLIEYQLSLVDPSLVLQFYDYVDLPFIQQCDPTNTTSRDCVQQE